MYGLVNKAMKDLINERFGEEQWQCICHEAGADASGFISLESYPDEMSYALVGAASSRLDIPTDTLLEEFGKYWVLFTANEGYGEMMRMFGNSLPEFLSNLDEMHQRMALIMPDLQPPSFSCTRTSNNALQLNYRSERKGLVPMVVGLVKGLGERFHIPCSVELITIDEQQGTRAEFHIEWENQGLSA